MSRPEPYCATDRSSFAYESTAKRWPIILTGVINDLYDVVRTETDEGKATEGKALTSAVGALKYEIEHDRKLTPLEEDGGPTVAAYNDEIARLDASWFSAPWLFAECYLYRRLRVLFAKSTHYRDFDPFLKTKLETFRSSQAGVFALAKILDRTLDQSHDPHQAWLELGQAQLWGNATDLSLLTNLTQADITRLQAGSADKAHFILANDFERAWQHLSQLKSARVDIVLDNSGFELFTDLVMADWLVSTPHCSTVVFHPKLIPWFVSDVTPHDFKTLFSSLQDLSFFSNADDASPLPGDCDLVGRMVERWVGHLNTGRWQLSVPLETPLGPDCAASDPLRRAAFWTEANDFHSMPADLISDLRESGLVIFKGDLNMRKLLGDRRWPADTPFATALGPLAGQIDLLALRTCKADVVAGLRPGQDAELDASDARWRVSGSYAVVQFCARK